MAIVNLGEIADIFVGVVPKRYLEEGNGNFKQLIVQGSMNYGEKLSNLDSVEFSEKLNDKYLTKNGDILMKLTSPNDAIYIEEEGLVIGERIAIIRLLDEEFNYKFIAHLLNSSTIKKQLNRVIGSGVSPKVSIKDIKDLQLDVPELDMQNKLALILDSIDDRISIYNDLIESDKKLKEGILLEILEVTIWVFGI